VPEVGEIPARGAALFGAVAAGVYEDIGQAIEATRPRRVRTYEPNLEAKKTYDRVYEIYRTLYDTLGRSDVRLMHELKRIRTQRSGA
jgi:L-ribulokinase